MLCRVCGSEMVAFEYCPDCSECVHWRCSICQKENDKSVHVHHAEKLPKVVPVIGALVTVASGFSLLTIV